MQERRCTVGFGAGGGLEIGESGMQKFSMNPTAKNAKVAKINQMIL